MDRKKTELDTLEAKQSRCSVDEVASKTRALLRQGDELDERGLPQQAIHLWTRVLFLDRGNREARGRIERAKGALAEQQRVLDGQIGDARRLFERGEVESARELLVSVLTIDPGHGEASRLLADIAAPDRRAGASPSVAPLGAREKPEPEPQVEVEPEAEPEPEPEASTETETERERKTDTGAGRAQRAAMGSGAEPGANGAAPGGGLLLRVSRRRSDPVTTASRRTGSSFAMGIFLSLVTLGFAAGGYSLYLNWESITSDGIGTGSRPSFGMASTGFEPLGAATGTGTGTAVGTGTATETPAPDRAELRYYNGARLFAKGRYREALAELERVDRGSVVASRARSLILRIEERLLRGAVETDPDSDPDSDSDSGVETTSVGELVQ